MTKSKNQVNNLAIKMAIALGSGLLAGTLFIFLREYLVGNGQEGVWNTLNLVLFQDISSNSEALGIFYILGQLFVNALQL
ncbi:MAG: dicarboxylate/amino acid:cation symporter, partial [Niameybacter sp.]